MKNPVHYFAVVAMLIAALLGGCKEYPPASLYQEKPSSGPSVTSLTPSDSALGGVTTVTIAGSGFSTVKENNYVYFGSKTGTVLEATASQLRVLTPIFVSDSTPVKVAVQGMDLFSNAIAYKLKAAVLEFGVLPNTVEEPNGMTCDAGRQSVCITIDRRGNRLGSKEVYTIRSAQRLLPCIQ